MICERFLSDYREIFEAEPRKSRDNHSKTSNRASCVPNSFPEKAQDLKCAFSLTLFSFTSEEIFHCSEENNANPRKIHLSSTLLY